MIRSKFSCFTLALVVIAAPAHAEPSETEKNLARFAKGVFAEMEGDLEKARGHYEATLAVDAESFGLTRKTANIQLADDDLSAASKTLRKFAEAQPEHLSSQVYFADFLEQNAPRDAIAQKAATEVLEAADKNFPNNPNVFPRLINLHENRGEREKSLAVFNSQFEAVDAGPAHWMSLGPIARTLLPGDSPELAEKLDVIAEKIVETGVGIPYAARSASDYYRKTNRMEEAIAVLQKHIEVKPDSLDLRTRMGLLQIYAKKEEEGLKTLEETLRIDPDQVLAHKSLSQYYARNGDPEKALHHSAEILRISGGAPEDFLEVANQYLDLDKPHPARLLLEKARFDHPEDPAIAARLAIATLRDGDTTQAARLFRQAESLAKDAKGDDAKEILDADFQLEFATSLADAGDNTAAESRLREAIRGIPPEEPKKSARALRALAKLWIDQNKNLSPAASLLKRAEGLEPGNPETKALLDRARTKN